jgi:hypothetical protein
MPNRTWSWEPRKSLRISIGLAHRGHLTNTSTGSTMATKSGHRRTTPRTFTATSISQLRSCQRITLSTLSASVTPTWTTAMSRSRNIAAACESVVYWTSSTQLYYLSSSTPVCPTSSRMKKARSLEVWSSLNYRAPSTSYKDQE